VTSGSASRYLIKSLLGRGYVTALDAVLHVVARDRKPRAKGRIDRLLVGIGGHIGDAIIATSALRWVRIAMPDVKIGVAVSSVARAVVDQHPRVSWIHTVDHWKMNRSPTSWMSKRFQSATTNRRCRAEIREVGYDAGVDLYPYYPNMSVLFWRSGIPVRVGYISGGGGPAYTSALVWPDSNAHMAERQQDLLREIGPDLHTPLEYDLPPIADETLGSFEALAAEHGLQPAQYVVLHPGSGDVRKNWPLERWSALISRIIASGRRAVITGSGMRDTMLAGHLIAESPNAVNLCGATDLSLLRLVLRQSAGVFSIDSAAAHLAAAEGTHGVVIMSPMINVVQWRPLSPRVSVLMDSAGAEDAWQCFTRTMASS
jgi:ADP-heptose:LPS heptosyltransferase